jgi:chromosome segregation ATPase
MEGDAAREAVATEEEHARELQRLAEALAVEQAAAARAHATELAKAIGERDEQILTLQQTVRSVEGLAKGLEEGTASLRETQQKTQRELAETKERYAQLEADVKSLEERLLAASGTTEVLNEEKRVLREQLEINASEARRGALDRMRFVAYLEEGLALLGALPPQPVEPPEIETIESSEMTEISESPPAD